MIKEKFVNEGQRDYTTSSNTCTAYRRHRFHGRHAQPEAATKKRKKWRNLKLTTSFVTSLLCVLVQEDHKVCQESNPSWPQESKHPANCITAPASTHISFYHFIASKLNVEPTPLKQKLSFIPCIYIYICWHNKRCKR